MAILSFACLMRRPAGPVQGRLIGAVDMKRATITGTMASQTDPERKQTASAPKPR